MLDRYNSSNSYLQGIAEQLRGKTSLCEESRDENGVLYLRVYQNGGDYISGADYDAIVQRFQHLFDNDEPDDPNYRFRKTSWREPIAAR